MRAGSLRHPVTIQSATETRDAAGGVTKTWADVSDRWAEVKPISGREYLNADRVRADITHVIVIRNYSGLTSKHRIKFTDNGSTRYFNIESVRDMEERDRMMQLFCKEDV